MKGVLQSFLENPENFTGLDLSNTRIGTKELILVSEKLKVNTTLATLNLASNLIKDGVEELSEALSVNTTLTSLNLYDNWMNSEKVRVLSLALKVNTTLTHLNIGRNFIGVDGIRALSEALTVNTTLTALDISSTIWGGLGGDAVIALAEALKVNTTLTNLNLAVIMIDFDGANTLLEALKMNGSLTTLFIQSNKIGAAEMAEIATLLDRNKQGKVAVRRAILYVLGIRWRSVFDHDGGMGFLGWLPRPLVKLIAREIWKTRGSLEWLNLRK